MIDIVQLSGRELDAVVAERVMGWRTSTISEDVWYSEAEHDSHHRERFRPSESIEAAMQVVEKMRERGFAWDVESWTTPAFTGWEVKLWKDGDIAGEHRHEALTTAICHAALKAIDPSAD